MKVGILSMQRIKNYGSFLQAYGLKKTIESLGHNVEFVDYKYEKTVIVERKKSLYKKILNNINIFKYIKKKYPNLKIASDSYFLLSITALITDIYKYRKEFKKEYKLLINELKRNDYKNNNYIPTYKKIMIFFDLHSLGWFVNIAKKILK